MQTYFMFGKYTPESLKGVSGKRTEDALALVKRLGGRVEKAYALLGKTDLVLIAEFPGTSEALQASLALSRLTGMGFSTSPAVKVEDFDKLASGL